jgi:hypothetical protein
MVNFAKQKASLESQKRKIKDKEKMLREQEKRISEKNLVSVLMKSKIAHLDQEALMGALLEISEKANDTNILEKWREKSSQHNTSDPQKITENPITISFKSHPPIDVRNMLKDMKFKWNSFRGEYYGFWKKNIVKDKFKNYECTIEEIN